MGHGLGGLFTTHQTQNCIRLKPDVFRPRFLDVLIQNIELFTTPSLNTNLVLLARVFSAHTQAQHQL